MALMEVNVARKSCLEGFVGAIIAYLGIRKASRMWRVWGDFLLWDRAFGRNRDDGWMRTAYDRENSVGETRK